MPTIIIGIPMIRIIFLFFRKNSCVCFCSKKYIIAIKVAKIAPNGYAATRNKYMRIKVIKCLIFLDCIILSNSTKNKNIKKRELLLLLIHERMRRDQVTMQFNQKLPQGRGNCLARDSKSLHKFHLIIFLKIILILYFQFSTKSMDFLVPLF